MRIDGQLRYNNQMLGYIFAGLNSLLKSFSEDILSVVLIFVAGRVMNQTLIGEIHHFLFFKEQYDIIVRCSRRSKKSGIEN